MKKNIFSVRFLKSRDQIIKSGPAPYQQRRLPGIATAVSKEEKIVMGKISAISGLALNH
ncbi:hypothetical protein GTU79_21000 [Sodalis ligni]|uniref:hypothetical protein n=1 Tax=Sodalis ligni TaxID=2697027 RepID=UPI00193FE0D3|nr:hypothetical protein [Sodalis ligni]QWA09770.1 hypothetical protein GTU79_21000 [Sodalis ligni]